METEKNDSVGVSIRSGWGSLDFDVVVGVIGDAGRVVAHVSTKTCAGCGLAFCVGDTVSLVTLADDARMVQAFHSKCLPVEFLFI